MQNRLGKCREAIGLTQEQFSEKYNIKRSTLASWESNFSDIPLKQLVKLTNIFDLSIDYILGLSDDKIKYSKIDDIDFDVLTSNLRDLRKKHRLTQSQVSDIIEAHSDTYSKYERSVRKITGLSLYIICKHFNVSMDEMLGRTKIKDTVKNYII